MSLNIHHIADSGLYDIRFCRPTHKHWNERAGGHGPAYIRDPQPRILTSWR
jgi:hypothetical protein